ncbi:helix-turn-helix transcriptional regulator [Pseudocnuella soli]|uniref:helix-turn-helix transcriptional regulator n=1 Tax=Pseudocnuella soli TaxID=2502779 RepID=UPI00104F7765|nr:WYL domain-containing protein [Pseudocnuella soli]
MSVRLQRLIRIYNRLRRGPVTIEIVSRWAKGAGIPVSDRQLYRDLNTLQNLHIAKGENVITFTDEKNRKTWKLEYDAGEEPISPYDINSFFLLKAFAPSTMVHQRKDAIEKFEQVIYKALSKSKYQQYIQANELYLHRTNFFDHTYGEAEHQQIEELIWALHNNRVIAIENVGINSANVHLPPGAFPLELYPMQLVFHRGRSYISGLDAAHKLMLFPVDKETQFRLTNTVFNRKNMEAAYNGQMEMLFGVSDPVDDQVYRIEIEFTKGFGESWMRYFWHHSQQWVPLEGGNYMLHLHCTIGRELIGFLAYGLDKVKVHQPEVLKQLIWQKLQQAAEVYAHNLDIDEEQANKDY